MTMLYRLTLATTLAFASAGIADALPAAPRLDGATAGTPGVEKTAMVVTRRVVRGPLGGRRVVTTRRVVRRGPLGGRQVTVTKTVR